MFQLLFSINMGFDMRWASRHFLRADAGGRPKSLLDTHRSCLYNGTIVKQQK